MTSAARDGIRHEWTGTGTTSPITLGGAVAGFNAFPSAFNGLQVNYLIANQEPGLTTERENGQGTYTHSGTTLTRGNITVPSSGSPVNFSAGTKHVSLVGLAADRAYLFDTCDATSADVTWDGGLAVPIVQVTGHVVSRNLDITPAPSVAAYPARSVLVCNFGSGAVTVRDDAASTIGTVSPTNIRQFDWDGSAWAAGLIWLASSIQLDNVDNTDPTIDIDDDVRQQNIITLYDGSPSGIAVTLTNTTSIDSYTSVTRGNSEHVTVAVASGVEYYLRGDDMNASGRTASFEITGSATITCIRIDTGDRRYLVLGETDHEQTIQNPTDFGGQLVYGNRAKVITGVTGTLTSAHDGAVIVTSGNVTIPNTSSDVGFNVSIIAGGAHTVTFNSLTSAAMASGDVMTVIVQSTTVIKAALIEAADLVAFS